jgi:hypothetical protein
MKLRREDIPPTLLALAGADPTSPAGAGGRAGGRAAAIHVTSWLGIATLGLLWPLALIWAFLKPFPVIASARSWLTHRKWRTESLLTWTPG